MNLPSYTWDQAAVLGLATARGFGAMGINAATIRQWVKRDPHIEAVGKAPGGAHLYKISVVSKRAGRQMA